MSERLNILGMKVITSQLCPGDVVLIVKDMEVMSKVILTANLLADQEIEIEELREQVKKLQVILIKHLGRAP